MHERTTEFIKEMKAVTASNTQLQQLNDDLTKAQESTVRELVDS